MAQVQQSDKEPTEFQSLPNDSVYVALADKRRRYTLHYLKQRSEPVTLRELSEQVAAWENRKGIEELTSQERKRVYIALYQSHLNTLDEQGLVDYDEEGGTVALTEAFANSDLYLEIVPEESVPWSLYYLGLTAANAVVLALVWADFAPFDAVPAFGWAGLVLVTFGVSAVFQTYSNRRMRFGDDGPPPELAKQ